MPTGIPAQPRAKLTFAGSIGAGKWATSCWFQRDIDTAPTTSMATLADVIYASFASDALSAFQAMNQASTNIQTLTVDLYHASSNASWAQGVHVVTGAAGIATFSGPASMACVATLYSAGVGKTSRGRMYWPATGGVKLATPYVFDSTQAQDLATGLAAFLGDVDGSFFAQGAGHVVPSVSSGGSSLGGGPGPALYPIIRVGVDTQPDRQEHRERGITYTRLFATV